MIKNYTNDRNYSEIPKINSLKFILDYSKSIEVLDLLNVGKTIIHKN